MHIPRTYKAHTMYAKILTLALNVKPMKLKGTSELTGVCTVHKHVVLRCYSVYNRAITVKCFNHLRQFRGVRVNVKSMFLTWRTHPIWDSLDYITMTKMQLLAFSRRLKGYSICTRTHETDTHVSLSPPQQRSIRIYLIKPLIVARFGGFSLQAAVQKSQGPGPLK